MVCMDITCPKSWGMGLDPHNCIYMNLYFEFGISFHLHASEKDVLNPCYYILDLR